jgi:hypothetical protein
MRDFPLNKEASENLASCEESGIEVVKAGCPETCLFVGGENELHSGSDGDCGSDFVAHHRTDAEREDTGIVNAIETEENATAVPQVGYEIWFLFLFFVRFLSEGLTAEKEQTGDQAGRKDTFRGRHAVLVAG